MTEYSPHLVAENPKKYLKYVCIEGEEYVRQFMDNIEELF